MFIKFSTIILYILNYYSVLVLFTSKRFFPSDSFFVYLASINSTFYNNQ